MERSIRELKVDDVDQIINYFHQADNGFLKRLGVDPDKLPLPADWRKLIVDDLSESRPERQLYYLIWELNGRPVGHSNINKIAYGEHAYMHLHIWEREIRYRGSGNDFIGKCITRYFTNYNLKNLFCEPNALNRAPNRTLAKAGFKFVKKYETVPGWINFHQTVNRWVLSREKWLQTSNLG